MLRNRMTFCEELLDNEDGNILEYLMILGVAFVIIGSVVKVLFPKVWNWVIVHLDEIVKFGS